MQNVLGWILAGLGLVALVLAGLWLGSPAPAAEEDEGGFAFVVPVTLTPIERGDLVPSASLTGTVRAARRARLGFDTSGLIRELAVREAERVEAGQVLARLDRGDEEHELAAAEATLRLAQRELELLEAGERDEEKRRLAAVLEAARAEVELGRLEVERGEKLLADRIIAQSELDRRRTAFDAAEQRRVAAEEEHERALKGTREEELAVAQARLEEATARVDTARHALAKTELVAPWGGAVVERVLSEGDFVSAGDAVFELADLANLEVHVEVPGRFAPYIGPGSRVRMTLPDVPDFSIERALDATIPSADEQSRSFRAIVRLGPGEAGDDGEGRLKPGMFVRVELYLEPLVDALLVSSDAVLAGDRGRYLVRAASASEGLVAELVPLRVLAEAGGRSAVTALDGSLAEGQSAVLTGADNAFPGASLMAREDSEEGSGERAER